MSQFFTSSGQRIGVSASASVLPMNIQDWFPLGWTDWISLQSKGLSRIFSNTTIQKHQFFFIVQLSHPYMTTGKTIAFTRRTFVGKVMSIPESSSRSQGISLKGWAVLASDSKYRTLCLFQASDFLLYFDKSMRSEVWHLIDFKL